MKRECIVFMRFSVLFAVVASYELKVLPETLLVHRALHSNLMFSCESPDAPEGSQLLWYDNNGSEVKETIYASIHPLIGLDGYDKNVLKFQNIETYYEGTYKCRLIVDGVLENEVSRDLKLFVELAFVEVSNPQHLKLGSGGLISCEPKPGIEVPVKWTKNSVQLVEDKSGKFKYNRSGLFIRNVKESDAGTYLCELRREEPFSFVIEDIEVKVHGQVKITKKIGNNIGIEGTDFTLTCEASGFPTKYQFFFNGTLLENDTRINVFQNQVSFTPLKRKDNGNVACSASNPVSSANSTGLLSVHFPPSILSFPNKTFANGEDISVECLVEGRPVPTVTITKVENNVHHFEDGYLKLSSITPDDAGLYTCEILSPLGNDSATNVIIVNFEPIVSPDQSLRWTTYPGIIRNISCKVLAHPPPHFQWFLSDVELSNNATFQIFNEDYITYLQIYIKEEDRLWILDSEDDSSEITCLASNSIGSTKIEMILALSEMADQLTNVKCMVYPCQVDFYVSMPKNPGDEPIIGIKVEILEVFTFYPWSNHIKIKQLESETYYDISIQAVSDVGGGNPTDFEITTLPPSAPYPIILISSNSSFSYDSYLVEWEDLIDVCFPILQIQIKYRRVTVDSEYNVSTPLEDWIISYENGSATSMNLTDLWPDSYYQLEVTAHNELGWSEPHKVFIFQTAPAELTSEEDTVPWLWLALPISAVVIIFLVISELFFFVTKRQGILKLLLSRKK